jgi:hypothetical protein
MKKLIYLCLILTSGSAIADSGSVNLSQIAGIATVSHNVKVYDQILAGVEEKLSDQNLSRKEKRDYALAQLDYLKQRAEAQLWYLPDFLVERFGPKINQELNRVRRTVRQESTSRSLAAVRKLRTSMKSEAGL